MAFRITSTQTSPPDMDSSSGATPSCSTSKRRSPVTRASPAVSTRRLWRSRSSFFHMTVLSPTSRTTHVMSASSPSYTCTGCVKLSRMLGSPNAKGTNASTASSGRRLDCRMARLEPPLFSRAWWGVTVRRIVFVKQHATSLDDWPYSTKLLKVAVRLKGQWHRMLQLSSLTEGNTTNVTATIGVSAGSGGGKQ